jgi:hypothetical protein
MLVRDGSRARLHQRVIPAGSVCVHVLRGVHVLVRRKGIEQSVGMHSLARGTHTGCFTSGPVSPNPEIDR